MVPAVLGIWWQSNQQQKQEKRAKTTDDPQIPQPDLRFTKENNSEARNKRGRVLPKVGALLALAVRP